MATPGPVQPRKQFVLCFDGTGNKFAGDGSDTNLLKIYRMLDRTKSHQFHYYQPGIGTYVASHSLSNTGRLHRIKSAYRKAKDSAIGSSFDEHVLGGYKFLMRYYSAGDDIYLLGFSRGAYIARFLAEMLEYIGLLEAGNEEMIRFAWKTFAKWKQRRGDADHKDLSGYIEAFRDTFSRPISQIRFMGLFDTVNSVPAFENAWMQRSKFPYTARSSAKIIRHAVSIDERRAKFRQDLISERPWSLTQRKMHHWRPHLRQGDVPEIILNDAGIDNGDRQADAMKQKELEGDGSVYRTYSSRPGGVQNEHGYRASRNRKAGLTVPGRVGSMEDLASIRTGHSGLSPVKPYLLNGEDESVRDIKEVWFPGQHGDVGGGWKLDPKEIPLSHVPLVWMVKEAQLAGLQFDPRKLKQFRCYDESSGEFSAAQESRGAHNDEKSHAGRHNDSDVDISPNNGKNPSTSSDKFYDDLDHSITKGVVHDCLRFGGGLPALSVLAWWIMEYLPFRRMDLQPDGSWKPINWPLPYGEVRDIPHDAEIHVSAIRRMQVDCTYRPGNLIIGGGGRGIKRLPQNSPIGEWVVCSNRGDPVRETYKRKRESRLCEE